MIRRRSTRFNGDVKVMAGIIDLDPELDPREWEYWRIRLREGGLRRVLRMLRRIVIGALCGIGFAMVIFALWRWLK